MEMRMKKTGFMVLEYLEVTINFSFNLASNFAVIPLYKRQHEGSKNVSHFAVFIVDKKIQKV